MQLNRVSDLCLTQAIPCSMFDLARVERHRELVRQLRSVAGDMRGRDVRISDLRGSQKRLALEVYRNLVQSGSWCGPRWCNNRARFH